ncbi:MAG: DUF4038 domain-containing protein, partial [Opitutales bacterium]
MQRWKILTVICLPLIRSLLLPLAAETDAGPLRVAGNGRFLETSGGDPIFLHTDTAWSLPSRYAPHEVSRYLDTSARQGFNAIQFSAVFPKRGVPLLEAAFED